MELHGIINGTYLFIRDVTSSWHQETFSLSNNYTSGSGGGERELVGRREGRLNGNADALPMVSTGRGYAGSFDFEGMLLSLRELFALDRQVASQADAARCGICYLYFAVGGLHYREEEGFYVCGACERALGKQVVPMLRRQQK